MLTRRVAVAAITSAVIVAVTGCGSGTSTSTPTTPSTPTISAATVTIQPAARTLATAAFTPNPVTVSQSGTVTWSNTDTTTHDMIADSGAWDSGRISPGGTFNVTLGTRGSIPYHCSIHPGMVGTIVVQ
jgi:plastocyanin